MLAHEKCEAVTDPPIVSCQGGYLVGDQFFPEGQSLSAIDAEERNIWTSMAGLE